MFLRSSRVFKTRTLWLERRCLCSNFKETGAAETLKKLATLAESDPQSIQRLARSLSERTLKKLNEKVSAEKQAYLNASPPRPTNKQLWYVALSPMPLFICFGIIDNSVMIMAGEYFDYTLGVAFGISTMAAASLGNLVSDVLGLGAGGVVETWIDRLGIGRDPGLTRAQEGLAVVRRVRFLGNAVGVSIGCLIGMFPLLFMDFDSIARLKRQSQIDDLFVTVMDYVSEAMMVENATLYIVDQKKEEMWTKASAGRSNLKKVRFPLTQGVAGHCARSGDVINTNDSQDLQRYGSKSNLITGEQNHGVLCTPIFGRTGDIIGVLQVANRKDGKPFLVKDEVALTAMSSHISCALERAFKEDEEDPTGADRNSLLFSLKASFEHHTHHLRFATSRAEGESVELVSGSGKQ